MLSFRIPVIDRKRLPVHRTGDQYLSRLRNRQIPRIGMRGSIQMRCFEVTADIEEVVRGKPLSCARSVTQQIEGRLVIDRFQFATTNPDP